MRWPRSWRGDYEAAPPPPLTRGRRHSQTRPSQPAHGEVDQLLLELRVRWIEKLNGAEARRLLEHAARVRERLEAEEAMGLAHAALPHSTEGEIELIEMDQRVVDHRAARPGISHDGVDDLPFAAE